MEFKIGLVLEGGGMRGVYTSGVLDFFMENNLYFPYVIGVSAGSCNAASYVSKQIGRNKKVNIGLIDDPRYLSYRNLIKEKSFFGMNFLFYEVPNKINIFDYETFNKSKIKLYITATDCGTGKPHYFDKNKCKDFSKCLMASSSIPLFSPMVKIDGKEYLDGAVSDSIPIKKSIEDGYEKNVIILTRNKGYKKEPYKLKRMVKVRYKKYPNLINSILKRHKMYNETLEYIEKLEKENKVFVFRPSSPMQIDRFEKDKNKLINVYNMGYNDAKEQYENLKIWILNK